MGNIKGMPLSGLPASQLIQSTEVEFGHGGSTRNGGMACFTSSASYKARYSSL